MSFVAIAAAEPNPKYFKLSSSNFVARDAHLIGGDRITLGGRSVIHQGAALRGDLARISVGRFCSIAKGVVLRPALKIGGEADSTSTFGSLHLGDYSTIGENSIVSASAVGSYCSIGSNCVISRRCVLKDCCRVLDNSVVPPGTTLAPFSVYGGVPAVFLGDLSEATPARAKAAAEAAYHAQFGSTKTVHRPCTPEQ